MLLKEVKEKIDFLMKTGHENDLVVITTKDISVGPRGYQCVENIFSGMDWENGQIRIEPEEPVISLIKDRDKPLIAISKVYDTAGRKRYLRKCPKCEEHLKLQYNYCPKCGQKIIFQSDKL